jgi:hypothetical protein
VKVGRLLASRATWKEARDGDARRGGFRAGNLSYEAFNGGNGSGLTGALKALQTLVRLNALAHRGITAGDSLVGDDAFLIELAVAIECAADHALDMWEKGEIRTEEGA